MCEVETKAANNGCWQVEAFVRHSAKCGRSAVIKVAIQLSIAVSNSIFLSKIVDESGKRWVAVRDILASAPVFILNTAMGIDAKLSTGQNIRTKEV